MTTSGVSAADMRQALTCGLAIVWINLCFSVLYHPMYNTYPAQAFPMDIYLFHNQFDGAFFNRDNDTPIFYIRADPRDALDADVYIPGYTSCWLLVWVLVVRTSSRSWPRSS